MTRAAYFECFAGASGDMVLGALVDAGWPEASLRAALESVPVGGWQLNVGYVKKGALHATQVRIDVLEPQPERSVPDIAPLIEASTLAAEVKGRALSLFQELAEVEALEHDQRPETVHFHEVGAVDSILDIVGSCAGLHALGIEALYVSPINVGGGVVATRDGILPVPGPAALELLKRKGAPIYASEYGPEFLTPTGALLLATLADGFGPFPSMQVEHIGYGAGQRDFAIPNVLRVSIGELRPAWRALHQSSGVSPFGVAHLGSHEQAHEEVVVQLETNIDDMNPEWYGHLTDHLLGEGALDVTLTPVMMKKGRPGTLLSVLVHPTGVAAALARLFGETTTLGVRCRQLTRYVLDRRTETVDTPYGAIRVKLALYKGAVRSAAPEYDDCRAAALRSGATLQHVYAAAIRAAPVGEVAPA